MSVELKVGDEVVTIDPERILNKERFHDFIPAGGLVGRVVAVGRNTVSIHLQALGLEEMFSLEPDADGDSWATFYEVKPQ